MEKKDYLGLGAISILILSTIFGFIPEETDTHVCIEFDEVQNITLTKGEACVRLSSTERTCYPNLNNTRGYRRCSVPWLEINRTVPNKNDVLNDLNYSDLKERVRAEFYPNKTKYSLSCSAPDGFVNVAEICNPAFNNLQELYRIDLEVNI